jgi:mRNA interferase RelE/StbE
VAEYAVIVSDRAAREIDDLPARVAGRIYAKLEALAADPRPHGVKKLRGTKSSWRIRVGEYRVLYEIDDRRRTVDIGAVRHRSKAYE